MKKYHQNTHNLATVKAMRIIILIFCVQSLIAQPNFVRSTDINVQAYGNTINYPWIGGLNNPQFSAADLDNDGIDDLVIFDRGGDNVVCLRNGGTPNTVDYSHAPQFEKNFPEMFSWALLRDYNCDGVMDIFTSAGSDGVAVYSGYYVNNSLHFELAYEKLTHDDELNLYVPIYDVPAISDLDGDDDLDILTFGPSGGYVRLFENISNDCTVLDYTMAKTCWGRFYESGVSEVLDLDHSDCEDGALLNSDDEINRSVHPGSTLLTLDLDSDGDQEIILGDISFNTLTMAVNGGDNNVSTVMTEQDASFPSYDVSADMPAFPGSYSIDVNNDGLNDLLVSPNAKVQSEHYACVWHYNNTGASTDFFSFQSDTFLIDNTIDVNRYALPAFFDHNSDGLLDLIVGNYGYMAHPDTFVAQLALYENVGTPSNPQFNLVTRNYMQVQDQFIEHREYLRPTFGDIDGDGDKDMLLGDNEGFLHFFENEPDAAGVANFTCPGPFVGERFQNIDVYQFTAPQLIDINGDDLLDLLLGYHNGRVAYFQNVGTSTEPDFEEVDLTFGSVDVRQAATFSGGYATPYMTTINDELCLFVGSEYGTISMYTDIEENLGIGDSFTLVTNNLSNINVGTFASIAFADLDDDSELEMLVGTYRGGVMLYEQEGFLNANVQENILQEQTIIANIYPNPASKVVHITIAQPIKDTQISLYNMQGKQVYNTTSTQVNTSINTTHLPAGIYLIHLQQGIHTHHQKLLIE